MSIQNQSSSSSSTCASSSAFRPSLCRQIPFFGNELQSTSTSMDIDIDVRSPLSLSYGSHDTNTHGAFSFGQFHPHSLSLSRTSLRAIKRLAVGHCRSSIRPATPNISNTQYNPFLMSIEDGHNAAHNSSSGSGSGSGSAFRNTAHPSGNEHTPQTSHAANTHQRVGSTPAVPAASHSHSATGAAAAPAPFDNFAWTVRCLPTLEKSYGKRRLSPIAEEFGQPAGYLDCLF
jgi:hypothetical protein